MQPEIPGGIYGCHLNGTDGVESQRYRLSDHGIYIALSEQICAGAVVYYKEAPFIGLIRNQRQQFFEIFLRGALSNHEVHAAPQFLSAFLEIGGLMVGADSRREIG